MAGLAPKALTRKLLRDLARLKGQIATIALVLACGMASFIGLRSTHASLVVSRATYYDRFRFAHVFAQLERAPEQVSQRMESIRGVARVYTRITEDIRLPLSNMPQPALARLISLPDQGRPPLNDVYLQSGRMPDPGRDDEVLILESFAQAHGLVPGSRIPAVIAGRARDLTIAGIALSPEYVYAVRPGGFMDDRRGFGILWMRRSTIAAAFNREGAFNDVVVQLNPGASLPAVMTEIDRILTPYGGLGAVSRDRQSSHQVLDGEISQLQQISLFIPVIFLGVAAFLVNVVLTRLINIQRPEIAALKALGYTNREIAFHLFGLVLMIAGLGIVAGLGIGIWFANWMTNLYANYFRFPVLTVVIHAGTMVVASMIGLAAATLAAWTAIRGAVRLPPAEAMRPPAPARYLKSRLERVGLAALLGTAGMMVFREVRRHPFRTLLSAAGIGAGIGILIVGRFSFDSFDYLMSDIYFRQNRDDLMVTFTRSVPDRILGTMATLPGVQKVEGARVIPVRLSSGSRRRDSALLAFLPSSSLRRLVTRHGDEMRLADDGLVITEKLAEILDLQPGSTVDVEIRDGARQHLRIPVAGTVDEAFGLQAYIALPALEKLLNEERSYSQIWLRIDPTQIENLSRELNQSPWMLSMSRQQSLVDDIRQQTGNTVGIMTLVMTLLASSIALGVVYNNARIALSLRSRDLASLRVLGFSLQEISLVLLGELALQLILAIPLGLWMGHRWAELVAATVDPETIRFPVIVSGETHLFAVGSVLLAGLASALWVRRKLDRLDLIAVLKTRE